MRRWLFIVIMLTTLRSWAWGGIISWGVPPYAQAQSSRDWVYTWDPYSNECVAVWEWDRLTNAAGQAEDSSGLGNAAVPVYYGVPTTFWEPSTNRISAYNKASAPTAIQVTWWHTSLVPQNWTAITVTVFDKGYGNVDSPAVVGAREQSATYVGWGLTHGSEAAGANFGLRQVFFYTNATQWTAKNSSAPLGLSAWSWHQLAFTWRTGDSIKLYQDGFLVGTSAVYSGGIPWVRTNIHLFALALSGSYPSKVTSYGYQSMDSLRIYGNLQMPPADIEKQFWEQATTNGAGAVSNRLGHGWVMLDYNRRSEWSNTVFVGNVDDGGFFPNETLGCIVHEDKSKSGTNVFGTVDPVDPVFQSDMTNGWAFWNNSCYASNETSLSYGFAGLAPTSMSVGVWLWPSSTGDIGTVWSFGDHNCGAQLIQSNGLMTVEAWTNTTALYTMSTADIVAPSQWLHTAVTFDGGAAGAVRMWTNAVIAGTGVWSIVPQQKWCVGSDSNQLYFYWGRMDELRISKGVFDGEYITNGLWNMTKGYHP